MSSRGGRTPSGGGGAPPRRSPRLTASAGAKPRINIQELRRQKKKAAAAKPTPALYDPLAPCDEAAGVRRAATGLVYDERLLEHRCLWDDKFPEAPDRLQVVFDKCSQLGLVDRCERVEARLATDEELQSCHSPEHVQKLRQLCDEADPARLREEADKHDSVYLHPATFRCAALAAGSTIQLTDLILDGKLQNGFAMVRPPGHHAEPDDYSGYCFFNNVALAARHAADRGKRVLIVDWDVHHGQGTQEMFYFDDRVLYFSVHRYDGGTFWPGGGAGDWERCGAGVGAGLNWNVPLEDCATDADLLAVWYRLLLPAAYQFAPDLVIVSAGFDMALGDPKGGMAVTPACYGHLTHALLALSAGRLLTVLEGGYCRPALAAAAAHTLAALLGDPPPQLSPDLPPPSDSVSATIRDVMTAHRPTSEFLARHGTFSVMDAERSAAPDCHWPPAARQPCEVGTDPQLPDGAEDRLNRLLLAAPPAAPTHLVCLATNIEMMRHRNVSEPDHPERPERLQSILTRLSAWGLTQRCHHTPGQLRVSEQQLLPLHEQAHLETVAAFASRPQAELDRAAEQYNSVFLCPESYDCALLAAGCVVEAVDSVLSGESGSGLCVVRPPGHHAEPHTPHGFCLFNNVAVAARHAITAHGLSRVLILDWDVHHGNGIQHMFYEDRDVLYISLHRHDYGFFFPTSDDGDHDRVGDGAGRGFNVNVPWNRSRMGGPEYIAALLAVVMPVAYQFAPELVLVSAGFDAARGDPLGGYSVPPEVYGHLTHHLTALAGGRVVVALEGGYNLTSIAYSMSMCARALLGDPAVQLPPLPAVNESAALTLCSVAHSQRPHWPAVAEPFRLPEEPLDVVRRVAKERRAGAGTAAATDAPPVAATDARSAGAAAGVEGEAKEEGEPPQPRTAWQQESEGASGPGLETLERQLASRLILSDGGARQGAGSGAEKAKVETTGTEPAGDSTEQRPTEETLPTGDSAGPAPEAGAGAGGKDAPPPAAPKAAWTEPTPAGDGAGSGASGSRAPEAAAAGKAARAAGGAAAGDTSLQATEAAAAGEAAGAAGGAAAGDTSLQATETAAAGEAAGAAGGAAAGDTSLQATETAAAGEAAGAAGGAAAGDTSLQATETAAAGEAAGAAGGAAAADTSLQEFLMLQEYAQESMYAVIPLPSCPHLCTVAELPVGGINAAAPCSDCGDSQENWVCLTCYQVLCGRYRACHMLDHGAATGHCMVLSLADLSAWCYICEAYVHNDALTAAKHSAHHSKFGVDMPGGDAANA